MTLGQLCGVWCYRKQRGLQKTAFTFLQDMCLAVKDWVLVFRLPDLSVRCCTSCFCVTFYCPDFHLLREVCLWPSPFCRTPLTLLSVCFLLPLFLLLPSQVVRHEFRGQVFCFESSIPLNELRIGALGNSRAVS